MSVEDGSGDLDPSIAGGPDDEEGLVGAEIEGALDVVTYNELLAAPGVSECDYATEGTGTYADIFCWLDFSFLANGGATPFTSEYVRVSGSGDVTLANFNPAQWEPALGVEFKPTGTPAGWTAAEAQPHLVYGRFGHTTCTPQQQCTTEWVNEWRVFGPIVGYPVEITLGDVGHLKFHAVLDVRGLAGQVRNNMEYGQWAEAANTNPMKWRSQAVEALQFPVNTNSFFGNYVNGRDFYTGVEGKPALYQIAQPANPAGQSHPTVNVARTELTLRNVSVTNVQNEAVLSGYGVVVADVETTDSAGAFAAGGDAERITWTSDKPFTWLPNAQLGTEGDNNEWYVGNACAGGHTPAFNASSTTATCLGRDTNVELRTGTAMLLANTPSYVKQEMLGGGIEGVAYALMLAKAEVSVEVEDWIVGGENKTLAGTATASMQAGALGSSPFTATVSTPGGSDNADGASATSGSQEAAVDINGNAVAFASVNPDPDNYTAQWSCEKTGLNLPAAGEKYTGATAPTGVDGSGFTNLRPGQKIACHVTYTPQYLSLVKTVEGNEWSETAPNSASDWVLTATGDPSVIAGAGTPGASVTKRPIAVGSYDLSEEGSDGYAWTGLSCEGKGTANETGTVEEPVASASVDIPKSGETTCTYTNELLPPEGPEKEINETEEQAGYVVGDTVEYTITQKVPRLNEYTEASIWDKMPTDGSLSYGATIGVYLNDVELVEGESGDYTVDPAGVTWTLTELGRGKLTGVDQALRVVFTATVEKVTESGSVENPAGEPGSPGYGSVFNNKPTPPTGPTPYTYWGALKATKVDQDARPLEGAEFQVTALGADDAECPVMGEGVPALTDVVSTGKSGSDGVVTWTPNEPDGSSPLGLFVANSNDGALDNPSKVYCLYETKVPAGYTGVDVQTVTITPGATLTVDVNDLTVKNTIKEGPALPLTGGQSAAMFTILGLVIAGGAAGGAAVVARKRRSA